jgi:asparagine synthase (glutamine-hydrolysing)
MFAFGIADLRQQRLFLARDHLGIKPLYYTQNGHYFAFASELQALRCIPDIQIDLDLQAIDQYLQLQYIPAPKTAFQQINKLPPAHRLNVTFDGQLTGPEKYWDFEFRPDNSRSEAEWFEALEVVLRESVQAHLVADVPFGAFLSGGVDSSAVVAYMAQILNQPVRTFSIGFEEEDFSELEYAQQAAQRWETEHHIEIVRPDALKILPDLVKHYGEPFGDRSAIPTFYVCQMARRFVPMVLSGDGGDETFAGYDSYRKWLGWLAYEDVSSPAWRQALRPLAQRLMPGRYPPRKPTLDNWLRLVSYVRSPLRQALWRPEYRDVSGAQIGYFAKVYPKTKGYSPSHMAQYLDINTYLPFAILTKVDIASMMHGLEVRTPLTDIRVLEFAATIPTSLNICKNGKGEWEGKLLLKKVLQRYYPAEFLQRPKMGFDVPMRRWFAPDGAQHEMIYDKLLGPTSTLLELFEPTAIGRLLEHNATGPLWLLLFLEEWLRQNRA